VCRWSWEVLVTLRMPIFPACNPAAGSKPFWRFVNGQTWWVHANALQPQNRAETRESAGSRSDYGRTAHGTNGLAQITISSRQTLSWQDERLVDLVVNCKITVSSSTDRQDRTQGGIQYNEDASFVYGFCLPLSPISSVAATVSFVAFD
jgi:hypothetical protein